MDDFLQRHRNELLQLPRDAIAHGFHQQQPLEPILEHYPVELRQLRATFVTLTIDKVLRGCVGTINAQRPLVVDICHNAFGAAFADPRFTPLSAEEYKDVNIEISVLSAPEPVYADSAEDLQRLLRPGIDGLILYDGWHRATFLPSVWELLPEPGDFLAHLKAKAGLPADYWSPTLNFERYVTEKVTA